MVLKLIVGLSLTGFGLALGGALAGLSWRRSGVTTREAWLAGSDLAAHSERYVRPDRVFIVRVLNFAGIGLLLAGVLLLVAELIRHPT